MLLLLYNNDNNRPLGGGDLVSQHRRVLLKSALFKYTPNIIHTYRYNGSPGICVITGVNAVVTVMRVQGAEVTTPGMSLSVMSPHFLHQTPTADVRNQEPGPTSSRREQVSGMS